MTALGLSLVLPIYNESEVLERNLTQIVRHLDGLGESFEVVAVDDGSKDDSLAILERLGADEPRLSIERMDRNRGKGSAVKHGVLQAKGERVLFMDADLSVGVEAIGPLLQALDDHDVAIGSRRVPGARITRRQPWLRETLGRCFTTLTRSLVAPGIYDFTCGFKAFRAQAARSIFERVTQGGWAFDAELIVIAQVQGLSIAQVPVDWRHEDGSKVRVGSAMFESLGELLRIRSKKKKGLYR